MSNIVTIIVSCWVIQHGQFHRAWSYHDAAPRSVCQRMEQLFDEQGTVAIIAVRCFETGDASVATKP